MKRAPRNNANNKTSFRENCELQPVTFDLSSPTHLRQRTVFMDIVWLRMKIEF